MHANRIAAADVAVSRDDLKKAENQVALQVHSLYFGILIARLQKQAAEQQTAYAEEHLRESEDDVRNGSALKIAAIQGQAGLLESQQAVLTAELQLIRLDHRTERPAGASTRYAARTGPGRAGEFRVSVRAKNTSRPRGRRTREILAAEEAVEKARAGVTAAKSAYIPDVTAYARQSYQDGVPFLVQNFGTFGVNLTWDVFDFGKRRAGVREHEAQLAEAEENLGAPQRTGRRRDRAQL